MSVKYKHADIYSMYFCTFTCFNWLPLFETTKSYDQVYNWFNILKRERVFIVAYVIIVSQRGFRNVIFFFKTQFLRNPDAEILLHYKAANAYL